MSDNSAHRGDATPATAVDKFNAAQFMADRAVSRVSVSIPVRVVRVSNTFGALSPIGTVDVLPLVKQIDGYNNVFDHETVYGLTYFRYQGGTSAVIMDPVVGDRGLAIVSDRDISVVKQTRDPSPPGSRRRFNLADSIYFGVILSGEAPTQYVRFHGTGIDIRDRNGNRILMSPSGISMNP